MGSAIRGVGRTVHRGRGPDRPGPASHRRPALAPGPAAGHANGVPPMNPAPHPMVAMSVFGDDEPVFAAHPDYRAGVAGPVFGQRDQWTADAIRRPSNRSRGAWKLRFPDADPVWNLRIREVCFALLNPSHRALREAGICLPAQPAALRTVTQICAHLTAL